MRIELELDEQALIATSREICKKLAGSKMGFTPVEDLGLIERMAQTGLLESGLIENIDGFWTIGRRDGEHVLIAYKPID